MTTPKKLKILGPYTPEHPGPFCTRDGRSVDLHMRNGRGHYSLVGYIGDSLSVSLWTGRGKYFCSDEEIPLDLLNAKYVQEPREFWINEYPDGDVTVFEREEAARDDATQSFAGVRTIHVREVLPGEGE